MITLVRSFGLPRPIAQIGDIVSALARAGIFPAPQRARWNSSVSELLRHAGARLPGALLQTTTSTCPFTNVSIAMGTKHLQCSRCCSK